MGFLGICNGGLGFVGVDYAAKISMEGEGAAKEGFQRGRVLDAISSSSYSYDH